MSPRLLIVLVGLALATGARAQELPPDGMSAVGLAGGCRSSNSDARHACREVIYAVMQTHDLMVSNHPQLAVYCPQHHGSIDLEAAVSLFQQWEQRNRNRGASTVPGAAAVLAALRDAAPCFR